MKYYCKLTCRGYIRALLLIYTVFFYLHFRYINFKHRTFIFSLNFLGLGYFYVRRCMFSAFISPIFSKAQCLKIIFCPLALRFPTPIYRDPRVTRTTYQLRRRSEFWNPKTISFMRQQKVCFKTEESAFKMK